MIGLVEWNMLSKTMARMACAVICRLYVVELVWEYSCFPKAFIEAQKEPAKTESGDVIQRNI